MSTYIFKTNRNKMFMILFSRPNMCIRMGKFEWLKKSQYAHTNAHLHTDTQTHMDTQNTPGCSYAHYICTYINILAHTYTHEHTHTHTHSSYISIIHAFMLI